jgi:hypothetical protein
MAKAQAGLSMPAHGALTSAILLHLLPMPAQRDDKAIAVEGYRETSTKPEFNVNSTSLQR